MVDTPVATKEFIRGYVEALLWTGTSEDPLPLDQAGYTCADFTEEAMRAIRRDCEDFLASQSDLIRQCEGLGEYGQLSDQWSPWELAGHDLLLTRQGHGTGFWDRGLGELGEALSEAARAYGDTYVWETGDGSLGVG